MTTPTTTDLTDLTIAQAAQRLAEGDVSSSDLTEAYLARIERLEPTLNAYVEVVADRARQDAAAADAELAGGQRRGPLHGVPIALKDLVDTEGIATAGGAEVYRGRVPGADAPVAQRLRAAGSVLLGKTNTHELAFGVTTNNPHFGATHNPWDPSRIPGGSSGGSGAAVASRTAAMAIGTDTGGSIRIPAALCGCVGLKATYGRVPKTGVMLLSDLADHVGPLARTVLDAALVLQAIAGYEAGDPTTVPMPVPDYAAALDGDVRGLRIGLPRTTMWSVLDDEVRAAAETAVEGLRELGMTITDVELPDATPVIGQVGEAGFFSVVLEESRWAHRVGWQATPERFGPDLAALYGVPPLPGTLFAESLDRVARYTAAVRQTLTEVDLLVMPTVPIPAPPIGAEMVEVGGVELPVIVAGILNTAPFNVARLPAITVPCGFTGAGLPVGLQLAGRPFDEVTVLRAAHAYEQSTSWHKAAPQL
jgi:Asp-tRNA(Asn)/Glu-tRNA(Gln) amidotransferase A subunit family amidase